MGIKIIFLLSVIALLANYDGMTAMEVDTMLNFIRRNLTSAEQAIELGTREVVDLEDIEAGYRQVGYQRCVCHFEGYVNGLSWVFLIFLFQDCFSQNLPKP